MKRNLFQFIKDLFSSNIKSKYSDNEIGRHVDDLAQGYEEYLKKTPEYHDAVIKRMYRKTKYKDESPEVLRDILYYQITSTKR